MSMTINKELPNPAALKAEFPVPEHIKEIKAARDKEIAAVFRGESDKFIVIVGPCSADNEESVCEYTRRLARVNEQVKDRLILIPRIYTNKPRTTGEGYKGMLHQPDPDKAPDLLGGIIAIQVLALKGGEFLHAAVIGFLHTAVIGRRGRVVACGHAHSAIRRFLCRFGVLFLNHGQLGFNVADLLRPLFEQLQLILRKLILSGFDCTEQEITVVFAVLLHGHALVGCHEYLFPKGFVL